MKKFTIYLAFLAAVLGSYGCHKEDSTPTEDTLIVPVVKSIEATRASASDKAEQLLFSVPVKSDNGEEYTLEAWISDTECGMPETKGTPITDDNLATEYGSFKTKAYCKDLSVYSGMKDATATHNNGSWSYDKTYKWPAAEYCPLTFCSYAPDASITNLSLASDPKAASFTYTLPEPTKDSNDAVNQKDLLFAMDTHDRSDTGEIDINFKHALTAVKFNVGSLKGVTINSISLKNFYSTGTCTCIYTPGESTKLSWKSQSDKQTYIQNIGQTISATETDNTPIGDSQKTFMMIPQQLPPDAEIIITYNTDKTVSYKIGKDNTTKDINGNLITNWNPYVGKTVTFKVNKHKYDGIDIVVIIDHSRSMTSCQDYYVAGEYTSNSYYIKPVNNNDNGVKVLIRKIRGNNKIRLAAGYFTGGFSKDYSNKTNFDGISSRDENSRMFYHFTKVTNDNYEKDPVNKIWSYSSGLSSTCSAMFFGFQEAFWEFYHNGNNNNKNIIIMISDGNVNSSSNNDSQKELQNYDSSVANHSIDGNNPCTHGLSNETIKIGSKQLKDGYTYNNKTIKADIYSIYMIPTESKYYTTKACEFMKAISSNCPDATKEDLMGDYVDNGFFYQFQEKGNMNQIFTKIYDKIITTPLN